MTELSSGTPLPLLDSGSSCACCAPVDTSAGASTEQGAAAGTSNGAAGSPVEVTTVLQVTGMTCGHCVASVTEELSGLAGVSAVDVDLVPGGSSAVSVTSAAALDADEVEAAIEEAGYTLAPTGR